MQHGAAGRPAPVAEPVRFATITGSEEKSMLLDNFTAYVAAGVDGQPVADGRKGAGNVPLEIKTGHRTLTVEFIRGAFTAKADVEIDAAPDASYRLKYNTDAQFLGQNSYCDFWIVDLGTGKMIGAVTKAPVNKVK